MTFSRLIDRVHTISSAIPMPGVGFTHVVTSVLDPCKSPVFAAYPPVNASAERERPRPFPLVTRRARGLPCPHPFHLHGYSVTKQE